MSNTARFWLSKIGVVLGVLVVLNVVAAVIGPGLSPSLDFNNPIAQEKFDQISSRGDEAGCVDLVISGASVASYGIDPERLTTQLGGVETYNAALFGSLLEVETDWLDRFVVPELDPAAVVYVLPTAVFHADSAGLAFNLDEWRAARATRSGAFAEADRTAADLFPLVRYREQLTDGGQLLRWATGRPAEDTTDLGNVSLRDSGFTTKPGIWNPTSARAPNDIVVLERRYADWDIDASELEALRAFTSEQVEAGTEIVYVIPPISAANIAAHPEGAADLARYRDAVFAAAAEQGIEVIDLSGLAIPDSGYADPIHLRLNGAQTFTDALAAELTQRGYGTTDCTASD